MIIPTRSKVLICPGMWRIFLGRLVRSFDLPAMATISIRIPRPIADLDQATVPGEQRSCFVELPDPRNGVGEPTTFLQLGDRLCELNVHRPSYGSWFIGQTVTQDGAIYVATTVDPLFVVLPYLAKAADRGYCDAETIVESMDGAALGIPALLQADFATVCDCKVAGDQSYYLLNQTKSYVANRLSTATQLSVLSLQNEVLEWLEQKVQQTKLGLLKQRTWASSSAEDASLTSYAVGLLGECISEEQLQALQKRLNVEPVALPSSGELGECDPMPADPAPKKPKADPKEAARQKAAEARQAAKTAKLAKQAVGIRKLSGFFSVKPSQ